MIPTLETERLVLRPHRLEDFESYAALWADPSVTHFIGGKPFEREASWSRFLRQAGMWQHMGFGFLAIEGKASGRFIGEAGFHEMRRALEPSIEGTLEAGWVLIPSAHGHGYMTEAMQRLLDWSDAAFPSVPVTCIIDPGNQPSISVATRLGFVERGPAKYHGASLILLERRKG